MLKDASPSDEPLQAVPIEEPSTLGYATLDADGLPPEVPEADVLIARSASLRKISKCFPRRRDVNKYIVKSFRRRFNMTTLAPRCLRCDEQTDLIATISWSFERLSPFIDFQLRTGEARTTVETRHAYCTACQGDWRRRVRWAWWFQRIGGFIVVGSFVLLLARQLPVFRSNSLYWQNVLWFQYGALVFGMLLRFVGSVGHWWNVPTAVRRLAPRWMKCHGVIDLDWRDEVIVDDGDARSDETHE